ncbi:MAG: hypothetical protein HQK49_15385 [Oligoflexia bacterium]|nr:hypothetical protein [Oligoflexia bacterium]
MLKQIFKKTIKEKNSFISIVTRISLSILPLFCLLGGVMHVHAKADDSNYQGSVFKDVWEVVCSDPYQQLPNREVTFRSFFSRGVNLLTQAALRTINSHQDLLPPFEKLVHANGVCLKGQWIIDEENRYSGYFKNGSNALIITRASVALSYTTRGHYRGFGFAGKIFPTDDEFSNDKFKTANFFAIDDLAGTMIPNYTNAVMTNEPAISLRPADIFIAPVAAAATLAFLRADINPGIRQLYEISELRTKNETITNRREKIITPKWMKIYADKETIAVDEKDFRNEIIKQIDLNGKLTFNIAVASNQNLLGQKDWKTIGRIEFTDVVASSSCDTRLHFHHPVFRANLNH